MRRTLGLVLMLSGSIAGLALAQAPHGHTGSGSAESEFAARMMQVMERMDAGMMAAKRTGNPDRDIVAQQQEIELMQRYLLEGSASQR